MNEMNNGENNYNNQNLNYQNNSYNNYNVNYQNDNYNNQNVNYNSNYQNGMNQDQGINNQNFVTQTYDNGQNSYNSNEKTPKKSNNALLIIIVCLLLGVVGFLVYDNFIKKEEPKQDRINNNQTNVDAKNDSINNVNSNDSSDNTETNTNPLIGTWEYTGISEGHSYRYVLVFRKNNTGSRVIYKDNVLLEGLSYEFEYSIKKEGLIFTKWTFDGEDFDDDCKYAINGNKLNYCDGYTYTKK